MDIELFYFLTCSHLYRTSLVIEIDQIRYEWMVLLEPVAPQEHFQVLLLLANPRHLEVHSVDDDQEEEEGGYQPRDPEDDVPREGFLRRLVDAGQVEPFVFLLNFNLDFLLYGSPG